MGEEPGLLGGDASGAVRWPPAATQMANWTPCWVSWMGWTRRTAMKAQRMTWANGYGLVTELANDAIERESAQAAEDAEDARTP